MVHFHALVVASQLLAAAPAPQAGGAPVDGTIQELMDDAEYQKARKQIDRLLRNQELPADERVMLYFAHAVCDISLGDDVAASQSFQKLLTLKPDHRPDPARTSPKVLDVFQLVKDRMQEQGALDNAYQPEFQPLADVMLGDEVPVRVSFKGGPAYSIHRLFIRYRKVGDVSFESAELARQPGGVIFAGAIPRSFLRPDEDDYAVDYYMDAVDEIGERLTGVGTAALPLQFRVARLETASPVIPERPARPSNKEQTMRMVNLVVPIVVGVAAVAMVSGVTLLVLGLTALDPGATHLWLRRFK